MDKQKQEERKQEESKAPETKRRKNPVLADGRTLTPEDEEALLKRLRDLGYIE